MRNDRIDLRLPTKQKLTWKGEASKRGLKLSQLIRLSVDDNIQRHRHTDGHGRTRKDEGEAARTG